MMAKKQPKKGISRRKFVRLAAVVPASLALAACSDQFTATTAPQGQAQPTTAPTTTAAPTATPAVSTTSVPATTTTAAATTQAATSATTSATTTAATTQANATTVAAQALPPTPTCSAKTSQTMAETEGPYFKPNSPQRTSLLETGTGGTKLVVTGYVLSTNCQPVKNALLDFWQADANGQYDNSGFKMRGHQFTDENGVFRLETVIPGLYPGRTRHIHVKVQAPNKPILTTQLYFPGEPRNQSDSLFNSQLLMQVQDSSGSAKEGVFNFVLNLG